MYLPNISSIFLDVNHRYKQNDETPFSAYIDELLNVKNLAEGCVENRLGTLSSNKYPIISKSTF